MRGSCEEMAIKMFISSLLAAFLQMRHYRRTTLVMMNNTWCVKRSITVFNANTVRCSYVVGQARITHQHKFLKLSPVHQHK